MTVETLEWKPKLSEVPCVEDRQQLERNEDTDRVPWGQKQSLTCIYSAFKLIKDIQSNKYNEVYALQILHGVGTKTESIRG